MKPFDYFSPRTVEQATHLLDGDGGTRALAGGTDLLLRLKRKQWTPRVLVDLKRIPGLREIALDDELHLGALLTLNDLIRSPLVQKQFPVLTATASRMASVQVRNLATLGGNLCNASPAADLAPPLIALNARAVIVGCRGERTVPLDQFFVGPGRAVLTPDEILREIRAPRLGDGERASYLKLEHRQAMDIAIVGVGIWLQAAGTHCEDVRIVLGAAAPVPLRARRAEVVLRGGKLTPERIRHAAQVAAEEATPIDDVRGSAWYRREMIEVLTKRQLLQCLTEMGDGSST